MKKNKHHFNFGRRKVKIQPIKIQENYKQTGLPSINKKHNFADKRRGLKLPKILTEELAEETGIHLGDGFLSDKKNDFRVKGHRIDEKEYYDKHIKALYKKIYNLKVKIKDYGDSYGFELYSQAIKIFKTNSLKIQPGKKDKITVPTIIKKHPNPKIIAAFLRGIFDTDGSMHFKTKYGYSKYYPDISIAQKSSGLIKDISTMLNRLNLNHGIYLQRKYKTIHIYGYNRLLYFEKTIGFNNPKHLKKIAKWKKTYPSLSKISDSRESDPGLKISAS